MKYYLTVNDRGQCFDPMNNLVATIKDSNLDKVQLLRYIFECKESPVIQYTDNDDHVLIKSDNIEVHLQLIDKLDLLKICNDLMKCNWYLSGLKYYINMCITEINKVHTY